MPFKLNWTRSKKVFVIQSLAVLQCRMEVMTNHYLRYKNATKTIRMTRQAVNDTNRAIDVDWFNVEAFLKPDPESKSDSGGRGLYIGRKSWLQKSPSEQQLMLAGFAWGTRLPRHCIRPDSSGGKQPYVRSGRISFVSGSVTISTAAKHLAPAFAKHCPLKSGDVSGQWPWQ